jgi:hypothetical protein
MTGCGKGFIYQNRMTAGKKQGATGITTVAPYVAGQWGRGITGCMYYARERESFLSVRIFSCRVRIFLRTVK